VYFQLIDFIAMGFGQQYGLAHFVFYSICFFGLFVI